MNDTNIRLFADDTAAFKSGRNLKTLMVDTAKNIERLKIWFHANKLTLNLTKTCYSIFHKRTMYVDVQFNTLKAGNTILHRANEVEYLGLTIDEILSWVPHVDKLMKSLTRYFSLFYKLRDLIPDKIKRQVYFAYIYSRISYGIQMYGCAADRVINKLQTISNKLLKVFLKRDRMYSTSQLHKKLNILKIKDIYEKNVLLFVFRCLHNDCIPVFESYYTFRCDIHGLNTRDKYLVNIPRCESVLGSTSVANQGAILWNKLPRYIREMKNKPKFKRELTKYKINRYE